MPSIKSSQLFVHKWIFFKIRELNLIFAYIVCLIVPMNGRRHVLNFITWYYLSYVKGSMAKPPSNCESMIFHYVTPERFWYGYWQHSCSTIASLITYHFIQLIQPMTIALVFKKVLCNIQNHAVIGDIRFIG